MNRRILSDLFVIRHPQDVLREVLQSVGFEGHQPEGILVGKAFTLARELYQGECPGYAGCETPYHDFAHAAETFLCMGRLLSGARLASTGIGPQDIARGLTAAILHDTGYIPKSKEASGHGARFHAEHEVRSMDFLAEHAQTVGLETQGVADCRAMIQGTMMAQNVNAMAFRSEPQELLVRMLSVADLLAQLSSATYLERLAFLYEEDQETGSSRYRGLRDCYQQAIGFDKCARTRIKAHFPQTEAFLILHFTGRWNTAADLYRISMDRQIRYLSAAVAGDRFDPRRQLRRWGSLRDLQRRMNGN